MVLRILRSVLMLVAVAAGPLVAQGQSTKAAPTDEQLAAWWSDLEKQEPEASRALLKFAAHPDAAVLLFRQKLQPLTLTEARLQVLLLDLAHDDEKIWKAAFEELEYLDPRLTMPLPALMDEVTESPDRQRLVSILTGREAFPLAGLTIELRRYAPDRYNFFAPEKGVSWWAECRIDRLNSEHRSWQKTAWTRAVRAISLLERLNSPESRLLLAELATGHPDAGPTKSAKKALERFPSSAIDGQWDESWSGLALDEPQASRSLLSFAASPEDAVRLFCERLRPLRLTES